jgi:phosphopantothenoylcysteine decarboxylase/phosphopantothenate--cysteine ligase
VKILITSGGTEEPIDGVRYITNFSTGKTGAVLTDKMTELGADITLLHSKRAVLPRSDVEKLSFTSYHSLDEKLKELLESVPFDAVIHLAAVSDFSVDFMETGEGQRIEPDDKGKISSDSDELVLHLKRNGKILSRLKDYGQKGKDLIVVGFKLTDTDSQKEIDIAVDKQLAGGVVDYTVHNNLRDISESGHPAVIYGASGEQSCRTTTKEELADQLYKLIKSKGNTE